MNHLQTYQILPFDFWFKKSDTELTNLFQRKMCKHVVEVWKPKERFHIINVILLEKNDLIALKTHFNIWNILLAKIISKIVLSIK